MPRAVACRHCGASLTGAAEATGTTGPRIVHDATIGRREPPLPPRHEATADTGPQRQAGESADDALQWSEADFERISQTAGLPREDPRERSRPRTGRSGFGRFRRAGGPGFARVFATTGRFKRSGKAKWIAAAVVLIAVGIGAGWLAGRWDGDSLIGQSYQRATGILQSLAASDSAGDAAPDRPATAPTPPAIDTGAVAAGAVEPSESRASTAPTTSEANRDSTLVSPRPVAVPPTPAPSTSQPSTTASLVPIQPSTPAAPVEPAVGASVSDNVPASQPWSVRDVQRELARLGYYTGGLDGQVGPLTRGAVEAFQRDAGLPPTGRIEPALVSELAARAAGSRGGSEGGVSGRLR